MLEGRRALERFRLELKEYFGVKHCFLVSSGKGAFALILLALKELFPDRGDVLIPAFTCYSVPSSVVRAGLRIRLCDLQANGLDFDFAQLSTTLSEAALTQQTNTCLAAGVTNLSGEAPCAASDAGDPIKRFLAVVPTHLFGYPSDVPRLRKLIQDPGVTIVEDAAQAMGETWRGMKLGTLGDVSFFSFGRGKAFSVVEGGAILTNRDDIAEHLNGLVQHLSGYGLLPLLNIIFKAAALTMFIRPGLFWVPKSMPFLKLGETLFEPHFPILKMSSFQAGLARNWRRKLDVLRDVRKKNVNRWTGMLRANSIQGSYSLGGQTLGLLRFPFRVSDEKKRQSLLRESDQMGMGIMPAYPASINGIPELKGKISSGAFPVAESCAKELITFPTHGYVTEDDEIRISGIVSRVLGGKTPHSA